MSSTLDRSSRADMLPPYRSHSQIGTYIECAFKYYGRYIAKMPKGRPQGWQIGGTAVHSTIEESEKQRWWETLDPNEAISEHPMGEFYLTLLGLTIGQSEWRTPAGKLIVGLPAVNWNGQNHAEDHRWWANEGLKMLRRYAQIRQHDAAEGWELEDPGDVEKLVEIWLNDRPVRMYFDLFLFAAEGGRHKIRDYKTGRVGTLETVKPRQFATYCLGARITYGVESDAEVVFLRAPSFRRRIPRASSTSPRWSHP